MRVALISDLHANEIALEAVLLDLRAAAVDQLLCLGDVATLGPRPGAILGRLRDLGCPCILGNHDEFLLDAQLIRSYTEAPVVVDSVDWCRAQLSAADLAFVAGFRRQLTVELGGGATLFLYHGSPRSHMEDLLSTTPPEEVDRMLGGASATVLAGGHTHLQMLRQHRGLLLVNPGSVGMPFKEPVSGRAPTVLAHAEYAIVEAQERTGAVSVTLRRVPLPRAALQEQNLAVAHPLREDLRRQYA